MLVRDESHVIRLMHRDAALSLDVEEFDSFETAEEYRDRLASFPRSAAAHAGRRARSADEAEDD